MSRLFFLLPAILAVCGAYAIGHRAGYVAKANEWRWFADSPTGTAQTLFASRSGAADGRIDAHLYFRPVIESGFITVEFRSIMANGDERSSTVQKLDTAKAQEKLDLRDGLARYDGSMDIPVEHWPLVWPSE